MLEALVCADAGSFGGVVESGPLSLVTVCGHFLLHCVGVVGVVRTELSQARPAMSSPRT